MSFCKNLAVGLISLSALSVLHSHLFTHAASTAPPVTRPKIIYMTGLGLDHDYDEDDYQDSLSSPPEVPSSVKTPHLHMEPCQYNPCLENQEPCTHLSTQTGCLCPGLSGADEPPHAPHIQALLPIMEGDDRGKVEVQWCAPSSVVSKYRVVVEGSNDQAQEFGDTLRRGLVGSLEVGTKVCVEALNDAGQSAPSEFSCKRYDPPQFSDRKLFIWVIGIGVALFLTVIIIVGVIFWKRKMCQKGKRNSADGLGNPSYSTEGTL